GAAPQRDDAKFAQTKKALEKNKWAFATIAPRGVGPTRYAEAGTPADAHVRRRFALLGQTLGGQRVGDVVPGRAGVDGVDDREEAPAGVQGGGDADGVGLHALVCDRQCAGVDLCRLPQSHREGPTFVTVGRVLDTPQALALVWPRKVMLYEKGDAAKAWE